MTDRIPSVFRFFQNVFILRIFVFVFNHFERSIFRERGELRGATRASRHPKYDRNFLFASFSTSFTRFSSSSVFKEHVKHVRVVRRSIQLKIPRRAFQRRSVSITRRLLFLVRENDIPGRKRHRFLSQPTRFLRPKNTTVVIVCFLCFSSEDEISFIPLKIGKEVNDVFFLVVRRIRTTGDEYRRRHRRQKKEKKKRLLPRLSAASSSSSHLLVVSLLTEFSPFARFTFALRISSKNASFRLNDNERMTPGQQQRHR
mmetsp:Transcript_4387/g.15183  ORF Transcript_4387/g.15183 Transcript_4387/m.15183 type:complete len:257 (+) Transcript_4387:2219-2989(+)